VRRLGIILPEDGKAKSEWTRIDAWLAGHGFTEVATQLELSPSDGRHDPDSLRATGSNDHLIAAAERLNGHRCGALIWACTSGSFIGGRSMVESQIAALVQTAKAPATSASMAIVAAAKALKAQCVDVLSPYPAVVTQAFTAFLTQMGIGIGQVRSLGCDDGHASHGLDLPSALASFAPASNEDARPVVIPDTAIDSLDFVHRLESESKRIVITANQACLWHGLHLLGAARPVERAGRLFRRCEPPAGPAETGS
jgi:maleate cis-trans isomerase